VRKSATGTLRAASSPSSPPAPGSEPGGQSSAVGGTSETSLERASDVFRLADASRYFPSRMKVMSIDAVSKQAWPPPSSPYETATATVTTE